jgi:nitroreductase
MSTIEFVERNGRVAGDLLRAAMAARSAPSIFNSQPWRWRIVSGGAELRADRDRQLTALDPAGRLLLVSCGAALHHARTALAGAGYVCEVDRLPDPSDPDLLARLRVGGQGFPVPAAVRRYQAIALRRTDRRPFADADVPDQALDRLRAEAEEQGAHLHVLRPDETVRLAVLAGAAAAAEFADPAYRHTLAEWTARPAGAGDGVPADTAAEVLPRPVPVRDFTPGAPVPAVDRVADRHARYAVLFTDGDSPADWLTGGEALSAVLLAATMEWLAVSPMSDVTEVPAIRELLRGMLSGIGYPVVVLRIGVPERAGQPPASPRRPANETVEVVRPDR